MTASSPTFVFDAPRASPADEHAAPGSVALVRIGLVTLAVVISWWGVWEPFGRGGTVALAATLVGGYPIFREAFAAVVARRMTMELSMAIAIVAAMLIGEFFTTAVIVLFVLVAEELEAMTVGRGRHAIKGLVELLPRTALLRRGGEPVEVDIAGLRGDDIVVVRPGARVPVDGVVISGHSFVDQSTITGESAATEKVPGASVYAGTINQSGVLDVRVSRVGRDTTFGKIVEIVERAEQSRAPVQKIADRLAGYLVYFAVGASAVTFLVTRDVRSAISVVIVAGACGIAAGTPLAILGAIGRAARQGAIVKGGLYVEALSTLDTVLLDKTGTLTFGVPEVVEVRAADGVAPHTVLDAATIAERPSEHPLAKAVLAKAAASSLAMVEPETFDYTPGKGVVATHAGSEIVVGSRSLMGERGIDIHGLDEAESGSMSQMFVARAGRFLGVIRIADVLRPEAVAAVQALRAMGIRTALVTGDVRSIAAAIGRQLGVDEVHGEQLPEDKVARVHSLVAAGKTVAMIGDGVNDAPALMQASVGVAMGSGTDVARESAQVVLLGNDLLKFVETVRIARRCRRVILQNFAGTLGVDGLGIVLAACGLLNPLLAAFIHVASELAFILNSTRLLPAAGRTGRHLARRGAEIA